VFVFHKDVEIPLGAKTYYLLTELVAGAYVCKIFDNLDYVMNEEQKNLNIKNVKSYDVLTKFNVYSLLQIIASYRLAYHPLNWNCQMYAEDLCNNLLSIIKTKEIDNIEV